MIKTLRKATILGESGATHVVTLQLFINKASVLQYRVMLDKVLMGAFPDLKSAVPKYEAAILTAEKE